MAHAESDADAIRRSLQDPEAFSTIYERHRDAVYNFLRWRVGAELAEEWLAETFTQAFRSRHRYQPHHASCRAWLLGIATHLASNATRSERRFERARARATAELGHDRATSAPLRINALDDDSIDPELVAAVRALTPEDREVLLLHAWGELSPQEIAHALGLRAGTVRSRMHRARKQVRHRLRPESAAALHRQEAITSTGDCHA